jgi:hypothetical protein
MTMLQVPQMPSREAVVHDVEHLEEGALARDLPGIDLDKLSRALLGLLLPESEMKIHGAHDDWGVSGGGYL